MRELRYLFLRKASGGVGKGCQLWKGLEAASNQKDSEMQETRGASADQGQAEDGGGAGGRVAGGGEHLKSQAFKFALVRWPLYDLWLG